ncbi:MAG: hypothetical protein ABF289_00500 [Clostridiales bacterium]
MKKDVHIEFIATDIDSLALMGFGSIENCKSVFNCLSKEYSYVNFNIVRNEGDLENIASRKPDLIFTGIKYVVFDKIKKHKIWISDFMEKANINYTGSGKEAILLEYDKSLAKKTISNFGIKTAPYFISNSSLTKNNLPIPFPLFVKPLHEGDGNGIDKDSVVYDFKSYQKKVDSIYKLYNQPSMVEKYIIGREFTVSIIESDNGTFNIMPVELIIPDKNPLNRILGYSAKSENKESVVKITNNDILKHITFIAKNSFIALGARDYGRIDILMDKDNNPYFLEANLVPGMTKRFKQDDSSYFPRACYLNNNMTYHETIIKITETALERNQNLKIRKSS